MLCLFWRLYERICFLFQLLGAACIPCPSASSCVIPNCCFLTASADTNCLLEVPLRLYRDQPENPEGPSHLSVLKLIISSKSHMPCEVTSPHALGVRVQTDLGGHYSVYHSYTLPSQNRCIEYFKFWSIRLSSAVDLVRDDGIPCSVGQDWYGGAWAGRPLHRSWKSQGSPLETGQSCSQSSGFQFAALSPMGSLQHSTSVWLIDLHYISEHPCGLPRGQRKGQRLTYCTDKESSLVRLSSELWRKTDTGPRSPEKPIYSSIPSTTMLFLKFPD